VTNGKNENLIFLHLVLSEIQQCAEPCGSDNAGRQKPGVAKAFLVDPFLGSEALQRVIARQGNENINLTILISPGDIDPDTELPDAKAIKGHAEKLTTTANEWSDKLY
jgi:hypothetical protein